MSVSWNLRVAVNDGKLEDFRTLMTEMVAATRKNEPGAQLYEWFLSADGTHCHINEQYEDSAATMVHLGNFGAHFAERFMGCVTPQSMTVYGKASDEVLGALAMMNADHLGPFGGFNRF